MSFVPTDPDPTLSDACREDLLVTDPSFQTYRMVVAYDGTAFSGWQVQRNDISIQGLIEHALTKSLHETVRVVGSGRTDAGVHALGQVAHFRSAQEFSCDTVRRSLNGLLPPAVRIVHLGLAPSQFHAQKSATGKEYHYHICLDDIVLPFDKPYVWHCRRPVNIALLEQAAQMFVGEHDFLAFANAPGHACVKKTSIRTIKRLDVVRTPTGVRLEFEGNGFLYKMVRNITGMLVSVSCGKRSIHDIQTLFALRDRRRAEPAAPAQGLFLIRVFYPDWTSTTSGRSLLAL